MSLKSSACTVQTRSMSRASDSLPVIRILTAADSSLLLPQKWAGRTRIILSCLLGVIGGVESLGWKHSILGEKSSCANYTRRCPRGVCSNPGGPRSPRGETSKGRKMTSRIFQKTLCADQGWGRVPSALPRTAVRPAGSRHSAERTWKPRSETAVADKSLRGSWRSDFSVCPQRWSHSAVVPR